MYKKYKNNYGWCRYPFENNCFGYCWGYACKVDEGKSEDEIRDGCSAKVESEDVESAKKDNLKVGDFWCEYYKEKEYK